MRNNIIKALCFVLIAGCVFSSCKKDPIGATAVVSMSGEWYVTCDVVDDKGEVLYEDPYGYGKFIVATFNTAANKATEMYVSDCANFWDFQVPVKVDLSNLTFSTDGEVDNLSYEDCKVKITDGKISLGTGKQPNGSKADEFEFKVVFSDDDDGFIYRLKGVRYSGLEENL